MVSVFFQRAIRGGAPARSAEFAPQLLNLVSTPPPPLPRRVLQIALALVALVLIWAAVAQLDIVAVAQGKVVPTSYLKIVQPAESGIVKEIFVREGEHVREGQVLMRMDPTQVTAEFDALDVELQHKRLALRRIDAELSGTPVSREPDEPETLFSEVEAQYLANRAAFEAAIAQERAAMDRARQEIAIAEETKRKLSKVLPIYREQDTAYRELAKGGFSGKLIAGEKERDLIEKEEELRTQEHIIAREKAAVTESERRVSELQTTYVKQLRAERAEAAMQVDKMQKELAKLEFRRSLMELRAPQQGTVKDIATHTIGTVVQPGTILMTLVPVTDAMKAEVFVSNDDIGFIRPGQPAKLKFTTFQFQKYGMLDGIVDYVAADAAEQTPDSANYARGQVPLTYRALVRFESQELNVDAVRYKIIPGMQVTAEIKLGERSLLEYLLSPVRTAFHEAARER